MYATLVYAYVSPPTPRPIYLGNATVYDREHDQTRQVTSVTCVIAIVILGLARHNPAPSHPSPFTNNRGLLVPQGRNPNYKMASSNIKILREESELKIQFQLDELNTHFSGSSSTNQVRFTDYFGPGLRFGSYSFIEKSGPRQLGLYLYTSTEYPALSIHFGITARSLTGELFFTKAMSYAFNNGEAIGWSKFLGIETYQASKVMEEENTLVLEAALKFTPLYPIVSKPTLSVLHHTIVGKETSDIRFIVYSKRGKIGKLSDPRALFGTQDALAKMSSLYEDSSKRCFLFFHH
jgi:hypothetical protein